MYYTNKLEIYFDQLQKAKRLKEVNSVDYFEYAKKDEASVQLLDWAKKFASEAELRFLDMKEYMNQLEVIAIQREHRIKELEQKLASFESPDAETNINVEDPEVEKLDQWLLNSMK